jgi:hypothetical protein
MDKFWLVLRKSMHHCRAAEMLGVRPFSLFGFCPLLYLHGQPHFEAFGEDLLLDIHQFPDRYPIGTDQVRILGILVDV